MSSVAAASMMGSLVKTGASLVLTTVISSAA